MKTLIISIFDFCIVHETHYSMASLEILEIGMGSHFGNLLAFTYRKYDTHTEFNVRFLFFINKVWVL